MTSPAITCKSAFPGSLLLTPRFLSLAFIWHERPWSLSPLSIWSSKRSCFEFGLSLYLQKLFYFVTSASLFFLSLSYSFRKSWFLCFLEFPCNSSFCSLTVVIAPPWSSDAALLLWSHSTSGQLNSPCCLGRSTPLEKFGNKVYSTLQLWAVTALETNAEIVIWDVVFCYRGFIS